MSDIQDTRYVLAIHDLESSIEYYKNKLGFKLLNEYPGWAFLGRESFIVMLGECKGAMSPSELGDHSYFAYIQVEDAERLYNEYTSNDVDIGKKLVSEPWGMKEFSVQTTDGHRIMFGEDLGG